MISYNIDIYRNNGNLTCKSFYFSENPASTNNNPKEILSLQKGTTIKKEITESKLNDQLILIYEYERYKLIKKYAIILTLLSTLSFAQNVEGYYCVKDGDQTSSVTVQKLKDNNYNFVIHAEGGQNIGDDEFSANLIGNKAVSVDEHDCSYTAEFSKNALTLSGTLGCNNNYGVGVIPYGKLTKIKADTCFK